MKLNLHIYKIKSIGDLQISFPIEKGLYAITGQNGSGKSTVVACTSRAFFNMKMEDYFGEMDSDAFIKCELGGIFRHWYKDANNKWQHRSNGHMRIKGFYEGSLIFGTRFRNTSYDKIKRIENVDISKLIIADDFIRINLGEILQKRSDFYEKVLIYPKNVNGISSDIFFYEKNGKRISQFHMSTGENLLISLLNSLNIRNKDGISIDKPCVILLDEIELALHPSSLKRLVDFLKKMSDNYNYAIYFSTHSIELISGIKPDNIFYIERHADNSIEILNPCYPAYATKFLYDHTGYDNVILVEDDLAKNIINRIIREESLMDNKLVHILPCGGHNNVLELADDVTRNNLLGKKASICVILDRDIKEIAQKYMVTRSICRNIPVQYLPIESLEKYLRNKLFLNVDQKLFRKLNNYIFQQVSLNEIIDSYRNDNNINCDKDNNGKQLFRLIEEELRNRNKDRYELVEEIVKYLFETNDPCLQESINFLKRELQ